MSLKRKIISGIISTFAVVSFTTFVSAQNTSTTTQQQDSTDQQQQRERRERRGGGNRNDFGRERRGGGSMMRGLERLNLTDAQKEQIRVIMEANRPEPNAFETIRPLMEAKRNGTITAEQEKTLQAFHEQMKQKHEQVKTQVLAVLTDEQRTQLEKMKAERKQQREERQKERQNRQTQQNPTTEKKDN